MTLGSDLETVKIFANTRISGESCLLLPPISRKNLSKKPRVSPAASVKGRPVSKSMIIWRQGGVLRLAWKAAWVENGKSLVGFKLEVQKYTKRVAKGRRVQQTCQLRSLNKSTWGTWSSDGTLTNNGRPLMDLRLTITDWLTRCCLKSSWKFYEFPHSAQRQIGRGSNLPDYIHPLEVFGSSYRNTKQHAALAKRVRQSEVSKKATDVQHRHSHRISQNLMHFCNLMGVVLIGDTRTIMFFSIWDFLQKQKKKLKKLKIEKKLFFQNRCFA